MTRQSRLDAARKALQNHQPIEAKAELEPHLAECPNDADALHLLGLAHAGSGMMKESVDALERAVALAPEDAVIQKHLGNALFHSSRPQEAFACYQKAIALAPTDAFAHHNLATLLAKTGDTDGALRHYAEALALHPGFINAHYNLGLLFLKKADSHSALIQFANVLALAPEHTEARFHHAVLLLNENTVDAAEKDFLQVLDSHPEHVLALTNLGVIALKRDEGQHAIAYFTKALALDNSLTEARSNLAATFMQYDRFENALTHYDILLQETPDNLEYLYNAAVARMTLGFLKEASDHLLILLQKAPAHAPALVNLAAIRIRQGLREEAMALLEKALALNPQDDACRHMLQALTGNSEAADTNPAYITQLFDNYALYYDRHMQETLHYVLPETIGAMMETHLLHRAENAVDLGAGTGLLAPFLRPLCTHLTGVDLSPKMLKRAKERGLYDALEKAELVDFFKQTDRHFDLITAAEVLPYIGSLQTLFAEISAHMHPGGLFIFSIEPSESEDLFHLQQNARFAHHPSKLQALLKSLSFEIMEEKRVQARTQDNKPLELLLIAARKLP
ncbi:methyltransferase [Legionella geestiana]|uniref:Methyltransferase n=1 Tax=Legionella geestiana TaxID=45065 RepID=A0A0W0U5F8_9GAMM|nr:tetratricopeptide repeat protein [Legionella geestiana]KTD03077.1 methyltransferase [Legionella geestiana]QBS12981.1 tetratricopeptide repeat protein [Legionella geestiana]STX54512.1 methyltransferase [Legionella geestiana]